MACLGLVEAAVAQPLPQPVRITDFEVASEGEPRALSPIGGALYFGGPGEPDLQSVWRIHDRAIERIGTPCESGSASVGPYFDLQGVGVLFASGECDFGNSSLWRLDPGTNELSLVQSEIEPHYLQAEALTRAGRQIFFTAYPNELWRTDGTPAGTLRIRDSLSILNGIVALGDLALLVASEGGAYRPWRSDGTGEGTTVLGEVFPHPNPAGRYFYPAANRMLFVGWTPDEGFEIWSTDGTTQRTRRVSTLLAGTDDPGIVGLVSCGDVVYFQSRGVGPAGQQIGSELWRSDGTKAGTRLVIDLAAGEGSSSPEPIGCAGSRLLFLASDGEGGSRFYASDGTSEGTTALDPFLGTLTNLPALSSSGWLFFPASTSDEGIELWASDGTQDGTFRTFDIWPGPDGSLPVDLVAWRGSVYFTADDGENGREIWRLDIVPADAEAVEARGADAGPTG